MARKQREQQQEIKDKIHHSKTDPSPSDLLPPNRPIERELIRGLTH
jgi:hypothetical protein